MALISSSIPNLISGVSQQPSPTRLRTSCEAAENAYLSVVSGLQKRQGSEFLAELNTGAISNTAATHVVKKSSTDKYVIVGTNQNLQVFDVETGLVRTVSGASGSTYLSTANPAEDLRFVTVADTTFVLNRQQTVTSTLLPEDGTRLNPYTRLSVFIKRAVASTTYAVYVNGSLAASTGTQDNTTASTALEGTGEIADELKADAISRGYSDAEVVGSVLTFTIPTGATVIVSDQYGGAAMRIIQDKVQEFSDLPPMDKVGRLVKVVGDADSTGDDYWVVFDGQTWVETFGWEQELEFDNTTMPHKLFDNGDGTFTFGTFNWGTRITGDTDSNAAPTFVGNNINSMFLYKGRMGLLSDENLIMSETSTYTNFFRTTVTQLLDTDRIDVASTTGRVNILQHAVAFGDNLVLFSDKQQFKVTQGDTLTPSTIGLQPTTSFDASTRVAPVNSGPNVFFAVDGPRFSIMRELYIDSDNEQFDAAEITVQVPKYIPTGIVQLAVSTYEDFLVAVSEQERNVLYVYKWFLDGKSKVQSAWSKWQFNGDDLEIIGTEFIDQDLIIIYRMDSKTYSARVRIEETVSIASDAPILLDTKVTAAQCTTVYDAVTDTTTIDLPYSYPNTVEFWRTANPYGEQLEVTKVTNSQYTVAGDETATDWSAGIGYTFEFHFSQQYLRQETGGGDVAVQDGRLQLRYMSVIYQNSSFFKVLVEPVNRTAKEYTFNGRVFADADNVLDTMPFDTGEFRFPIASQNTDVEIKLTSDKPFSCAFGSAEWDAMYHPRTRRV